MGEQAIRILLVEDDPEMVEFLRTHLAKTSPDQFEVTHTSQFAEALTLVHEQNFDVVLLDPGYTGTGGLDTVLRFLERAGDLPTLVLVDPLDATLALGAAEMGAVDYVIKGQIDPTLPSLIRHAAEHDYGLLRKGTTFSPLGTILGAFALSGCCELSRLLSGAKALHWASYTAAIIFGGLVICLATHWMVRLHRGNPDPASMSPVLPETS